MKIPELYIKEVSTIELSLLSMLYEVNKKSVKRLKQIKLWLKFSFFLTSGKVLCLSQEAAMIINGRRETEVLILELLEKINHATGKNADMSNFYWYEIKQRIAAGNWIPFDK